jgi:hypothetical protein
MRLAAVLIAILPLMPALADAQAVRYIDGVYVAPKGAAAPIELIAYAESFSNGVLRMQHGTLEDVPIVHEIGGAMVSVPNWKAVAVFVGSTALFEDERAERRRLPFAVQQRNVYAAAIRIADLEQRTKIDGLLKAVRASSDRPGYAFIVIASGGHEKYYPVRLTPRENYTDLGTGITQTDGPQITQITQITFLMR